ncbi:MAG: hypothetical protein JW829_19045 [Pirellulales bacterium]|nr:hypothetical protein [Pirellulales bacterium]
MSHDCLNRGQQESGKILHKTELAPSIYEFVLQSPRIAKQSLMNPGYPRGNSTIADRDCTRAC